MEGFDALGLEGTYKCGHKWIQRFPFAISETQLRAHEKRFSEEICPNCKKFAMQHEALEISNKEGAN